MSIEGAIGSVVSVARGVGGIASSIQDLISGAPGGSWLAGLEPASFRGVPFAVDREEAQRGRRFAVHAYAFRDQVWAEDTGLGPRTYSVTAFVIGDDCHAQARALLDAAEAPGPGLLVHPWLGAVLVGQVAPARAGTRKDLGRVVEIGFEFVETVEPSFPQAGTNTKGIVSSAAGAAGAASAGSFVSSVAGAAGQGASAIGVGLHTIQGFASQARSLISDASLISHAVAGLAAPAGRTFGRYGRGSGAGGGLLAGLGTVQGVLSAAVQTRDAVFRAADTVSRLGSPR